MAFLELLIIIVAIIISFAIIIFPVMFYIIQKSINACTRNSQDSIKSLSK